MPYSRVRERIRRGGALPAMFRQVRRRAALARVDARGAQERSGRVAFGDQVAGSVRAHYGVAARIGRHIRRCRSYGRSEHGQRAEGELGGVDRPPVGRGEDPQPRTGQLGQFFGQPQALAESRRVRPTTFLEISCAARSRSVDVERLGVRQDTDRRRRRGLALARRSALQTHRHRRRGGRGPPPAGARRPGLPGARGGRCRPGRERSVLLRRAQRRSPLPARPGAGRGRADRLGRPPRARRCGRGLRPVC